jgi:hypothetical protein
MPIDDIWSNRPVWRNPPDDSLEHTGPAPDSNLGLVTLGNVEAIPNSRPAGIRMERDSPRAS